MSQLVRSVKKTVQTAHCVSVMTGVTARYAGHTVGRLIPEYRRCMVQLLNESRSQRGDPTELELYAQNLHIIYSNALQVASCNLQQMLVWKTHVGGRKGWCIRNLVKKCTKQRVWAFRHSGIGTISVVLSRSMLLGSASLSRTLVRHRQPVPSSCGHRLPWCGHPPPSFISSPLAAVLGCATHCLVMIPTQWDGPSLVISTISKLSRTDWRVKVSWRIRI